MPHNLRPQSLFQVLNLRLPTTPRFPFAMSIPFNIHLRHRLLNQLYRLETRIASSPPSPQHHTLRVKDAFRSRPPTLPHVEFLVDGDAAVGVWAVEFVVGGVGAVPGHPFGDGAGFCAHAVG